MPKKVGRPKKEATEVIYVRIPVGLSARLREKAIEEERELSVTICRAILAGLEKSP